MGLTAAQRYNKRAASIFAKCEEAQMGTSEFKQFLEANQHITDLEEAYRTFRDLQNIPF